LFFIFNLKTKDQATNMSTAAPPQEKKKRARPLLSNAEVRAAFAAAGPCFVKPGESSFKLPRVPVAPRNTVNKRAGWYAYFDESPMPPPEVNVALEAKVKANQIKRGEHRARTLGIENPTEEELLVLGAEEAAARRAEMEARQQAWLQSKECAEAMARKHASK
jgi:hypothetical protein